MALFGQYVGNDTLPDLPYGIVFYQDFESDITGVSAWNSGSVAWETHELAIRNGVGGGSRGAILSYSIPNSTAARVMAYVTDIGSGDGIRVTSQWGTTIDTITETGWYTFYFTTPASGNGQMTFTVANASPDTARISFMTVAEYNSGSAIYDRAEVDDTINTRLRNVGAIFGNDFEKDIDGVYSYNYSDPAGPTDGAYVASLATNAIATFATDRFNDTSVFEVYVDITIVDNPIFYQAVWGTSTVTKRDTITTSGRYRIRQMRAGPQASSELDGFVMFNNSTGATLHINDIIITPIEFNQTSHQNWIEIGAGAEVGSPYTYNPSINTANDGGIAIGYNSLADGEGIAIGTRAIAEHDNTYGTAAGDDMMAIGNNAKSYGWRNTAIGNRAHAAGQSSTAIGTGAVALRPHSVALGRGSFAGTYGTETDNSIVADGEVLYLSNGWAHYFDTPLSGVTLGNDATPSNIEVKIYAQDAYDSRSSPASFNIAGGHLGLYSGRGTGTGEGGELRFYTAPQAGVGQNVKNDPVLSGKFDSDSSLSDGTDLWLLDRSDDTMKRVKIKEPTGSGSNKIIGFSRLYIE